MRIQRCFIKRMISMVLIVTMLTSLLSGCSNQSSDKEVNPSNDELQDIISDVSGEILDNIQDYIVLDETTANMLPLSYSWEDYQGNVETFAYGILANDMQYVYDVFPANVTLENGDIITGMGYTDYSVGYVTDDETKSCFEAGFIANCGEISIPQNEIETGMLVNNLDYQDDNTDFVIAYQCEPFSSHCVVYNKYVKYGVDNEGRFFYEATEYEKGKCDESLGSLYSYDEGRYLFDLDVGSFTGITGESLFTSLDYSELEKEINRVLETQDKNFVQVDIETLAYFSQEAITNYLLSLQEETFLGYNVDMLVEASKELDPMECYRITNDGLMVIDLEHSTEDQIAQWLVGTACVIAVGVGMVSSVIFIECPPLSAASSSVVGVAIEIFMQVALSGEKVSNIDWRKVGVAACAGAVSGFLGPYITATTSGAIQFVSDSVIDGLIGGIEQSVYAWMDGESGKDIAGRFGMGFALGFGLSAGFKGVSTVIGKLADRMAPQIAKVSMTLLPKLSSKISAFASDASAVVSKGIYKFKAMADTSVFHSQYIANKISANQLARLVSDGSPELKKKAFDNLSKENMFDVDGNSISKTRLEEIFDSAENNQIIGYFKVGEDIVNIKKQNGVVGIVFDSSKYQTVTLPNGIVNNRDTNFVAAAKKLKEEWISDPSKIPESISDAINSSGISLEDMEAERIVSIIKYSKNGWVMHENIDMKTISLVPRTLHDTMQGGISHLGGYSLATYLKNHMAIELFDRLKNAVSSAVAQGAL